MKKELSRRSFFAGACASLVMLAGCSNSESETSSSLDADEEDSEDEEEAEVEDEESEEFDAEEAEEEIEVEAEEETAEEEEETSVSLVAADENTPTQAIEVIEQAGKQQPVVVEYGYYINKWYELQLGVGIKNPSTDFAANNVDVEIICKSEDGATLATDHQILNCIRPCETVYFAYEDMASDLSEITTATISVTTVEDVDFSSEYQTEEYCINTSTPVTLDEYGQYQFDAVITAGEAAESDSSGTLSVILRDEDGTIVYGDSTICFIGNEVGETKICEVKADEDIPQDALTYELSWMPSSHMGD